MTALHGKVAVVTGGAMGLGAAIVQDLARSGAAVAVADINHTAACATVDGFRKEGLRVAAFHHDVTSWSSAFDLVRSVEDELGPVDILVNNAGVSRRVPFIEMTEAEWDRVIDINLKGQFLTTRAVAPGMLDRRRGRIVNLASVTAKKGFAAFSHYCSSKFAVMGLTQSLAMEFAPFDVTVNAVCPGIVKTPLHEGIVKEMADAANVSIAAADGAFVDFIPLRRPQDTSDVAAMVTFLAGDAARNMTGGTYHVDGGMVMD